MAEHLNYPKARIAISGGDLVDVYDVNLAVADGRQLVSTLRKNPSGSTEGKRAATLTFKSALSEAGEERPYWADWDRKRKITARVKVPGKTFTITGVLTNPGLQSGLDSFTNQDWAIIGSVSFV